MNRRVLTTSMAVAAFAILALAGSASAAQLTSPTGTRVAVGTKVKVTNVGNSKLKDASGNTLTECTSTTMTAEVIKNNGTEVEANITTVASGGTGAVFNGSNECTGSFGNFTPTFNVGNGVPWCLQSVSGSDEFTIRGNSCAQVARSITVVVDSTTVGSCKYNRTGAFKGTFSTDTAGSDAVLTMPAGVNTELIKEEGGVLCPSAARLEASYTLEVDEAGVTPMYIS
ncbi:MAG: hypothetical protein ACTHNY_02620 [Solirubrobacterales bacterium]